MKVAMVSEHASPLAVLGGVDAGGQNVAVAGLAGAMGRQGVEVVVHTRRDEAELPARVETPDYAVEHVDAGPPRAVPKDELLPFMDRFAEHLSESWLVDRPDVVHAHFWMSGWAALEAARPLGIPVVQTFHALGAVKRRHQGLKDTSPARRLAIEGALTGAVDGIIATCTDEVGELARLGADPQRVSVVPCGVDLDTFTPDGPCARRTDGMHRLVCCGRLVERKGIADVVEALAELPDTELVIAGGPPAWELDGDAEARSLLDRARDLGVADRVLMIGALERGRVPALLRSADAVVCVPWYEPFGIVPVEAMACGVPVVTSAVGGMLDTVVDGMTGIHVPPHRPAQLAEAVRPLLDDERRRRALGAAGTKRARALYGWDLVADETLAVYGTVASEAGESLEEARL